MFSVTLLRLHAIEVKRLFDQLNIEYHSIFINYRNIFVHIDYNNKSRTFLCWKNMLTVHTSHMLHIIVRDIVVLVVNIIFNIILLRIKLAKSGKIPTNNHIFFFDRQDHLTASTASRLNSLCTHIIRLVDIWYRQVSRLTKKRTEFCVKWTVLVAVGHKEAARPNILSENRWMCL